MKPNTAEKVEAAHWKQKSQHDVKAKAQEFKVGDSVYVRNYLQGNKWIPGEITEEAGPQMFVVKLVTGRSCRCHLDQIRLREGNVEFPTSHDSPDVEIPETPSDAHDKPHDQSLELEQPGDMTHLEPDESSTSDHSTDVGTVRDKYNGRSTDKIRTKMPRDWPHDIAVWQNGRSDHGSVLLLRALECPLFPSASMSSSRDTVP